MKPKFTIERVVAFIRVTGPQNFAGCSSEANENFNNTHCWLGFAEYLCLRLFGESATSISMASATGLFNQRNCDWDWDFVDAARHLSATPCPTIKTQTSARLTDDFALRWPALAEARLVTVLATAPQITSARVVVRKIRSR